MYGQSDTIKQASSVAVSVVFPLLKRLTFVNWDKKGNPFHIHCRQEPYFYRQVPVRRVRLDEHRLDQVQ